MTQEEKAEKYDEALRRARKLKEDPTSVFYEYSPSEGDTIADYIFPELKGSEDEKIRKGIIRNLEYLMDRAEGFVKDELRERIAWLKKQGEQDSYNGVSFKYNGHTWGMCARDNGVDILLDRQLIKHLEKQGKQEEPQVYKTKDGEIIAYSETDGYKLVGPKFKIGDTMRTLQEASNGITSGLPVVVSIDNEYYHCNNELIAIKDQDDYEYPPMNRRQKPVDNVEPFDKYEGLTDFERTLADICLAWISEDEHGWKQYIKDNADVLLKIAAKKFNSVQEQNPAWSEEDKNLLELSFENLTELKDMYGEEYGKVGDCISWLKSLKDRHTWKPSDEQMEAFEHFARSIGESGYAFHYDNNTKLLYSLLSDLKKLK